MPIVGGLDIHRKQITFDYLDTETGQVCRGQVSPADRAHLRAWLARFAGHEDAAFAVEGCTGWRYVAEERVRRRAKGLPNWRTVRYADDFVVLVDGTEADAEALREEIADVLAPLGLRLSPAKTRIVHMSDGFDFLGFRIQWKRKRGTDKWYVYTFIADRPIRSLKAKIRALTRRTSQQDLGYVLARLNMVMHGWARFFRHAVAKQTFSMLDYYTWRRVARMLMERHHWGWKEFRRRHTTPAGRWLPITGGQTELRRIDAIPVTRYRYRGSKIPSPWPLPEHA